VCFSDLGKLNLTYLGFSGLILKSSKFLLSPSYLKKAIKKFFFWGQLKMSRHSSAGGRARVTK